MNCNTISVAALLGMVLSSGSAFAQSPDYMREACANATQSFFQDFEARTDTTYEGERTDGTHDLVCLEMNTQPGMTATSLVPEMAAYRGMSFPDLVSWMVEDASCSR